MIREEEIKQLLTGEDWRDWIVNEARSWIGTPYQHKGRVKGVGADCGGMIYQTYNPLLGPFKPFPKNYSPDWALHKSNEIYLDFIQPYVTEIENPVHGGLAMFQFGRNYAHGTICTKKKTFIHSYGRNQHGSVIESGLSFFCRGQTNVLRDVKYYDVSKEWLEHFHS